MWGMVLGMLPVVGIPLPFLSYGGSSMVVLMTAVGLLMNISVRRFIYSHRKPLPKEVLYAGTKAQKKRKRSGPF